MVHKIEVGVMFQGINQVCIKNKKTRVVVGGGGWWWWLVGMMGALIEVGSAFI